MTCPRKRFADDLLEMLAGWRREGDRLIVCLDANDPIYERGIGKALVRHEDIEMKEVVSQFTGEEVGATYFRGSKAIDGVWATSELCVEA